MMIYIKANIYRFEYMEFNIPSVPNVKIVSDDVFDCEVSVENVDSKVPPLGPVPLI